MTRPLTIPEIMARRPVTTATPTSGFGMPSSSTSSLFTLSTAPPKRVLTIVVWNVQVFNAQKAEANPYVNLIIGKALEALSADMCILLETREHVSINLAAIQHRLANPVSNSTAHIPSEEEWDEETLIEEERARMQELKKVDTSPVGYQMIGSALTGKRYKPPKRLYLYGNPNTFFPKFLKSLANGVWKTKYAESAALRAYYAPYSQSADAPLADYRTVIATAEPDVEFRLQRCGTCRAHLGNGGCDACAWSAEEEPYLTAIRETIAEVAFTLAGVQLETYGVLVRPTAIGIDGGDGLIYFDDKFAGVDVRGCLLASHGVAPRPVADVIKAAQKALNCTETGVVDIPTVSAIRSFQASANLTVNGTLDDPTLTALRVPTKQKTPLGYQVSSSKFYGRSPFLIPLVVSINGAETRVPLVAFHAPYGKETEDALNARGDSVVAIHDANRGDLNTVGTGPDSIIMGDLNLDTSASGTTKDGRAARGAYGRLAGQGYTALTFGVKSSLIGLANNNWRKQKKKTQYDGAAWTGVTGPTTNFISSAYDNVLIRGALGPHVVTGAIVDVIDFIRTNLGRLDPGPAIAEYSDFNTLQPEQQAFFIYHAFISDHLPVLLDVLVDAPPPNFRQTLTKSAQDRRIAMILQTKRHFELTGTVAFLTSCPPAHIKITTPGGNAIYLATWKAAEPHSQTHAKLTVDFNGTDEEFYVRHGYNEQLFFGDRLVVMAESTREARVIRAMPGAEQFRGLGPGMTLMLGRVTRHSLDGKRFRVLCAQHRCTVPKNDGEPLPPVGTTVLVIHTGATLTEIATRP